MNDIPDVAQMDVQEPERRKRSAISLIWLVPLIAVGVILSVAYQTYQDRGVLIEIMFDNGSGITKETVIKYRDIDVGIVEEVGFDDTLDVVVVEARIDQTIAPFLDDDAMFWVVRPDVTLRGVTGLDTVLSGSYIAGKWDTEADVAQTQFIGLETPPLVPDDERGVEIVLRAPSGASLARGAPILHKGLRVGYLDEPVLDQSGNGVTAAAFIQQDFVNLVTTNTRFWDTSGFSISLGANGVALNVDSLASLVEGGIAFDTVISGGQPIGRSQNLDTFDIFDSESAARASLFENPDRRILRVSILFDESVNGLTVGSAVKYQGVRVGAVSAINAIVIEEDGVQRVRLRTTLELSPARIGISDEISDEDFIGILAGFVAQGMRARLITGSLLTGALEVELVNTENETLAFMDADSGPFPIIPTTASDVSDVTETAEGVLNRIEELPIEELMQGAIDLMASFEAIATDGDLRAAPEDLRTILGQVQDILGAEGLQGAPVTVEATLQGIEAIVNDLAAIVAQAEEADLVGAITATLTAANVAAADIGEATATLPAVIAEIEALAAKANALDVDSLLTQTTQTLATIDTLVASDDMAALPGSVDAALNEVRTLVAEVREGGAVDNLNAALVATNDAAQSVANSVTELPALTEQAMMLVTQLQEATANLPQITTEIEALVAKANAVEIDALVAQTEETLASINTLISSDSTQQLPASINASLAEIDALLTEVRAGGAVENINAALQAAADAAASVEDAAQGLPALSASANRLFANITEVANVYGERGRFTTDTASTLRDIQTAADAVTSLARAIQRNPSSILTGR